MARKLRFLHLANSASTNIGNGALILGTEFSINQDMPFKIEWYREPWDDYTFDKRKFNMNFVNTVNENYDCLLVGGAVAIHGRHYLKNTGMRFDLPLDLWPKIKKPIVFYGLSHRHWSHQPFHHLDKLKKTLLYIIENKNILFGVRNDNTKEWLEQITGIKSNKIISIPDPAIYVPYNKSKIYPEILPDRKNIIIAFNNEDATYRYGGKARLIISRFLGNFISEKLTLAIGRELGQVSKRRLKIVKAIVKAIERTACNKKLNIILVPHYLDDYQMMAEYVSLIKPELAHQNTISTGLQRIENTQDFYGLYANSDLSISMRVHSMSPCLGIGIPMIPLITQDRMWSFLYEAKIKELGLNAFSNNLENELYSAIQSGLNNGEAIKKRLLKSKQNLKQKSHVFHTKMAAILKP
jgi:hypothetical protein